MPSSQTTTTISTLLLCTLLAGCSEKSASQPATSTTNNPTVTNAVAATEKKAIAESQASPPRPQLDHVSAPAPVKATNVHPRTVTAPPTISVIAVSEPAFGPAGTVFLDAQGNPIPDPALVERANKGDKDAQREVGEFYGKQWRFDESNEWYRKAAEQGDPKAQHIMGVRYTFGQGVEQDPIEAGKWFLLAAEQGNAESQYSIAVRWARGEAGEPQDLAEAAKWFRLAAEQGLGQAQLGLGRRYAAGEGVDQDYIEAYKWMWLAKTQGNVQGAGKDLKALAAQMTPDQINQAKLIAQGFTPKPPTPINNRSR